MEQSPGTPRNFRRGLLLVGILIILHQSFAEASDLINVPSASLPSAYEVG